VGFSILKIIDRLSQLDDTFQNIKIWWERKQVLRGKKPAGDPPRYGRGTGIPNPIDVLVGNRIRVRRLFLGMNQETLGNALGLSFQQVQKYEGGANRVSASRLSTMADILGVPIAFFFDGLSSGVPQEDPLRERLERSETIELVRLYYAIPDQRVRQQLLEMVKAVAARKREETCEIINEAGGMNEARHGRGGA
jgi:transcriptional regulator with XRE-family HTH domain